MHCINLLPDNIYNFAKIIDANNDFSLYLEEQRISSKFSEQRRNEYTSGRIIAKHLLERIGIYNFPILRGTLGEPLWPQGVTGSISHCADRCFVAIAEKKHYKSIGIDIDSIDDLPETLIDDVCTYSEKKWIRSMKCQEKAYPYAKMIFSAKESAYKCIFPFVQDFIDFTEAEITFVIPENSFSVQLVAPIKKGISSAQVCNIQGNVYMDKRYIYSLALLAA